MKSTLWLLSVIIVAALCGACAKEVCPGDSKVYAQAKQRSAPKLHKKRPNPSLITHAPTTSKRKPPAAMTTYSRSTTKRKPPRSY